jgi:predicted Zn-dependent protease
MIARRSRGRTVLLGLLALSLLAGCSTNPVTGKSEMILISEDQEVAMGVEAAPQFEKEFGGPVPDASLRAYVQEVGQRIANVCDRGNLEYNYLLVRSNVPNAFALPGGQIFLTAGLMSRMDNERQLAAVLGHETGHVCAKHNVKGMQREMLKQGLITLGGEIVGAGDTAKKAAAVVGTMVTLNYSRDDEYQADDLGIKYMAKAGYNPYGMVELLSVLLSLHDKEAGSLGEMFQTHPLSSKRVARAREFVQTQYAGHRETAADPKANRFRQMRARLLKVVPDAR